MPIDYAAKHELVSDLFAIPTCEEEWEEFALTSAQVEFYREHGYLAGIDILNAVQVAALRAELQEFFQAEHEGRQLWYEYHSNESSNTDTVLFHALGAWRLRPGFHDTLWNPAFTQAASQLLDGAVRFWHDQLFCKPVQHGGVVAWHQDYSYWTRTQPLAHLTCWIGLDDSTRENGCLWYVPDSHLWPLLPITGLAGDMDAIREVLDEEQLAQFDARVPIELKAGQASFHHPLMVHGSYENKTDRPRRAMVLNVVRDGVRSGSDEPLLDGVDVVPSGKPLSGRFFPLLHSP